ncbi:MAG: AAA family ATPase [Bacteroidales bacterium]|nr:AAA family ATPase [Bacteroidales bacterium]
MKNVNLYIKMGVFSDNYFDLLSEANAIKKGNKGDELWSEITNVIQEQLIPFVNHYTGPFKALVRTNKPGQNGSYYLSHWCLFVINEKLSLGVKLTISKEGLSICYDFPHDKYKINKEEKVKIEDLGIDAITISISRDKVLSKTKEDLYDDIKEYHDKHKDKYYELEKIVQGLTVKEKSKDKPETKVKEEIHDEKSGKINSDFPLNQILFGPPGTGKTYNTVNMALDIVCPEGSQWEKEPRDKARKEYQIMLDAGQIVFVTFHQSMSYEDFIEGIKPEPTKDGKITYEVKDGIFKELCAKAENDKSQNYVMIIDEINRGNVANIFGELISLIEDDKRLDASEELHAELPYSHTIFGVPKNVYIIGTMNTADRSVEALDSALRRRFTFKEMMPKSELVPEEHNVRSIFKIINQRIEVLKDREHQIGHSYFMGVENEDDLKDVFYDKIIPLLQEYFYGDYEKIQFVLGEGFVKKESESVKFAGDKSGDFEVSEVYRIVPKDECNMDEAIGKLLNKASKAVEE